MLANDEFCDIARRGTIVLAVYLDCCAQRTGEHGNGAGDGHGRSQRDGARDVLLYRDALRAATMVCPATFHAVGSGIERAGPRARTFLLAINPNLCSTVHRERYLREARAQRHLFAMSLVLVVECNATFRRIIVLRNDAISISAIRKVLGHGT